LPSHTEGQLSASIQCVNFNVNNSPDKGLSFKQIFSLCVCITRYSNYNYICIDSYPEVIYGATGCEGNAIIEGSGLGTGAQPRAFEGGPSLGNPASSLLHEKLEISGLHFEAHLGNCKSIYDDILMTSTSHVDREGDFCWGLPQSGLTNLVDIADSYWFRGQRTGSMSKFCGEGSHIFCIPILSRFNIDKICELVAGYWDSQIYNFLRFGFLLYVGKGFYPFYRFFKN
jgi:hypothetical protein